MEFACSWKRANAGTFLNIKLNKLSNIVMLTVIFSTAASFHFFNLLGESELGIFPVLLGDPIDRPFVGLFG